MLLDVLADRLLDQPADAPLTSGEPDRMAAATMQVLRRNTLVPLDVLEPWVHRHRGRGRAPARGPATATPSP